MTAITYDIPNEDWAVSEFAAVVEFATDKISYFYVSMGKAYHYVAKKCEVLIVIAKDSLFTPEGYKIEMVNKIIEAMEAEAIPVPSDEKGYFSWLKNPQK